MKPVRKNQKVRKNSLLAMFFLLAVFFTVLNLPGSVVAANRQVIDSLEGGSITYTFHCRDEAGTLIVADYEIVLTDEDGDHIDAVEDKSVDASGYFVIQNLKVSTEYFMVISSDGEKYRPQVYQFKTAASGNSTLDGQFTLQELGDTDQVGPAASTTAGVIMIGAAVVTILVAALIIVKLMKPR